MAIITNLKSLTATNYIQDSDAESGVGKWRSYYDQGQASPTTGSAGAFPPTVSFGVSSISPLRGSSSFVLTKDSADRRGMGISYDFELGRGDLSSAQSIALEIELVSGSVVSGDIKLFVIANPDLQSQSVISPSNNSVPGGTIGTISRMFSTFTPISGVSSYRLCIHVTTNSVSDFSVKLDGISVGPDLTQTLNEVASLKSRVSALEIKTDPAMPTLSLERLGENSFDLTVTFSRTIYTRQLTASDFTLTGCSLSNFRSINSYTFKMAVTPTSPTSFTLRLNGDAMGMFFSSDALTRTPQTKRYASQFFGTGMYFHHRIETIGNPIVLEAQKRGDMGPILSQYYVIPASQAAPSSAQIESGSYDYVSVRFLSGYSSTQSYPNLRQVAAYFDFISDSFWPVTPISVTPDGANPGIKTGTFSFSINDLPNTFELLRTSVPAGLYTMTWDGDPDYDYMLLYHGFNYYTLVY